jgi:hypothetical protein
VTRWSFFYLAGLMANLREESAKVDKNIRNVFKHRRVATLARRVSAMDGGEYKIFGKDFHSHHP